MLGEFSDGVKRISSGGNRTECDNCEEAYGEVDRIGRDDEDDIGFINTDLKQGVGELGDGGFELGEGERFVRVGVDECEVG